MIGIYHSPGARIGIRSRRCSLDVGPLGLGSVAGGGAQLP
jgi:hypothetical protein